MVLVKEAGFIKHQFIDTQMLGKNVSQLNYQAALNYSPVAN
jgi:hypothetical protein